MARDPAADLGGLHCGVEHGFEGGVDDVHREAVALGELAVGLGDADHLDVLAGLAAEDPTDVAVDEPGDAEADGFGGADGDGEGGEEGGSELAAGDCDHRHKLSGSGALR